MRVTLRYRGPLASEAGVSAEVLTFPSAVRLKGVLLEAAAARGSRFRRLVLDRSGEVQPFVVIALDGKVVPGGHDPVVDDGAEVALSVAVSGG